jgi:hypothetical protein
MIMAEPIIPSARTGEPLKRGITVIVKSITVTAAQFSMGLHARNDQLTPADSLFIESAPGLFDLAI